MDNLEMAKKLLSTGGEIPRIDNSNAQEEALQFAVAHGIVDIAESLRELVKITKEQNKKNGR